MNYLGQDNSGDCYSNMASSSKGFWLYFFFINLLRHKIFLYHGLFNGINELVASLSSYQVGNINVIWDPGLLSQLGHQKCFETALLPYSSRTEMNIIRREFESVGPFLLQKKEKVTCPGSIVTTPCSKGDGIVKFLK